MHEPALCKFNSMKYSYYIIYIILEIATGFCICHANNLIECEQQFTALYFLLSASHVVLICIVLYMYINIA